MKSKAKEVKASLVSRCAFKLIVDGGPVAAVPLRLEMLNVSSHFCSNCLAPLAVPVPVVSFRVMAEYRIAASFLLTLLNGQVPSTPAGRDTLLAGQSRHPSCFDGHRRHKCVVMESMRFDSVAVDLENLLTFCNPTAMNDRGQVEHRVCPAAPFRRLVVDWMFLCGS